MRAGRDVFTARAQTLDRLFDQIDFINRVDIDGVNSGAYCVVDFVVRLAGAVEDDLIGPETDAQRLEEFAAAVDFDIDARVEHDFRIAMFEFAFDA